MVHSYYFLKKYSVCPKTLKKKTISEVPWSARAYWKLRKRGLWLLSPCHSVSESKVKNVLNFCLWLLFWQWPFWWRCVMIFFFLFFSAEPKSVVLQFCRFPGHWLRSGIVLAHGVMCLSWAYSVTGLKHGGTFMYYDLPLCCTEMSVIQVLTLLSA